ncbi:conserved protein, unknown function, partial [Hepatocystis sp. ex Piliocolobus tephrosceles]
TRGIFCTFFRQIFLFLFFHLLILFIKNESSSVESEYYDDNINVVLSENYERTYLLKYIKHEVDDCDIFNDKTKMLKEYLYNQINCFTDFFITDVLYYNFNFYIEKIEYKNLNKFLNFISLFYQTEINSNIHLFINLLNHSLLDNVTKKETPGLGLPSQLEKNVQLEKKRAARKKRAAY